MRQKPVEYLSALKGQEYEGACQELAKSLSSDLLKRGTLVQVNGVTYKLSNPNVKDIKDRRGSKGNEKGVPRLTRVAFSILAALAFLALALFLAIVTDPKSWEVHATGIGGSLLCGAAIVEFAQTWANQGWAAARWKGIVALGASLAFLGVWAPDFAESWNEFSKGFQW